MGRGIPSSRPGAHSSLIWHRDTNQQMLEEMWHSLVGVVHPTLHQQPHTLDEIFEQLKDATWHDFFQVFPYELREHATYLGHDAYHDELDALALLLASPQSKQRFQRYFERYADVITSTPAAAARPGSASSRRSLAAAPGASTQQLRLGLPLLPAADDEDDAAGVDGQQEQQQVQRQPQELPVPRRRGQQQQQQQQQQAGVAGPVAYVSPAAPGRLLAAAQPAWLQPPAAAAAAGARQAQPAQQQQQQQQQQQAGNVAENFVNAMLAAYGMTPDDIAQLRANAAAAAAAVGGAGAAALAAGTAAAAAGTAQRLTGRRRTWLEACEPDGQPPPPAAAAAVGTAAAARAQGRQATAAPQQQATAAAAASTPAAGNNSGVWRAVHEALTSDDEGLLQCVSRLVPYSFAGQLRDADETAAQLQALADSRPVPTQVVQSIAARLAVSSGMHLVRVSASSGYSRRAAAAAAALACTSRSPFYVSLAGCCTHEDVEAAIMRGVFAVQQQPPEQQPQQQQQQQLERQAEQLQQQQQGQAEEQQVEPAALALLPLPPPPQQQAGEEQQQQQQQQRQQQGAPQPEQQEQQQHAPPPAAAPQQAAAVDSPDAAAEGFTAAQAAAFEAELRLRVLGNTGLFWPDPGAAAAAGAVRAGQQHLAGPLVVFSDSDEDRIEGDSEFEDGDEEDGTDRCAEALAARLTLLGMCSEQPLLLLLDEADAAMLQQGSGQQTGGMFRAMLLSVLRQLPQVVLLVTDSFEPDALAESNSLRKQGPPAVYSLPDGKLSVTSYSIARGTYYYSCVHNF